MPGLNEIDIFYMVWNSKDIIQIQGGNFTKFPGFSQGKTKHLKYVLSFKKIILSHVKLFHFINFWLERFFIQL